MSTYSAFTPMVEVIPEGTVGIAQLKHYKVSKHESTMSGLRRGQYTPEGLYALLTVNGGVMMSDTHMEKRSNLEIVSRANGDVLIAGLGIGMILLPILQNDSVVSVAVIEKYQDVIDLVLPNIKKAVSEDCFDKLRVVCADVFDWKPQKTDRFDCVYFDIWPDICLDNLEEMATLHRKFASKLKGERYMNSWMRDHLKAERRLRGEPSRLYHREGHRRA